MSLRKGKGYFVGIDIGTSGCKGAIFDLNGIPVGSEYIPTALISPRLGWFEQVPDRWWMNVRLISQRLIGKTKISAKDILCIGISGTNGLIVLNRQGKCLRNAILFMDMRSEKETEWIKKNVGEQKIFTLTGNRLAPGSYSAPILRWIKRNEPQIYKKIYKILVPAGFIVLKLTNSFSMDFSRSSMTLLFDIKKLKWNTAICDKLGLDPNFLPPIYRSYEIVGEVTSEAQRWTGFSEGTPVIAGCNDTVSAGIGAGSILPGQSYMVLGTSGRICLNIKRPVFDSRFVNIVYGIKNQWLNIAAINSIGASLNWYKSAFNKKGSFDSIIESARKSKPGARGLIYLPYLNGERSPIWDPSARGVLFGLSSNHNENDVVRAILEGTAYAFKQNLDILEGELHLWLEKMIRVGGGGARNSFWCQVISDVLNRPLAILENLETETLGCAILAGIGIGYYKDFKGIVNKAVKISQVIKPTSGNLSVYQDLFQIYKNLYKDLRKDFFGLAKFYSRSEGGQK